MKNSLQNLLYNILTSIGSGLFKPTLHLLYDHFSDDKTPPARPFVCPPSQALSTQTVSLCTNLLCEVSLCYNAAIMLQSFRFTNNNNNNDNDDGQIVGRSFAG
jgi:hypothetical protein